MQCCTSFICHKGNRTDMKGNKRYKRGASPVANNLKIPRKNLNMNRKFITGVVL